MAYVALTNTQVQSGKAVTTDLLTKIKDNFDDHETRIDALELSSALVSVGPSSSSTASATDVILLTLPSLTVNAANPVQISLIGGSIYGESASAEINVEFSIYRGAGLLKSFPLRVKNLTVAANRFEMPGFTMLDTAATAGSYVYTLRAKVTTGSLVGVNAATMVAFELRHL